MGPLLVGAMTIVRILGILKTEKNVVNEVVEKKKWRTAEDCVLCSEHVPKNF